MSAQTDMVTDTSRPTESRPGRAELRDELSARVREEHGGYLERLAVRVVPPRSARGVVVVSIGRHAARHAGGECLGRQQERRELTRLLLRVCTDLSTAQGMRGVPRAMGWLSEVVVLRRMARALRSAEHLSHDEVAELLDISPATVAKLLG
ncbi:MAG: hypothetical protein JWO46_3303 [Nocardioidaceae bacterium]|nr:hypothetical protein [Nocardioidaceae bacterium]